MTRQQKSSGLETVCKAIDELRLSILIEIDHHVAAKDYVEWPLGVKRFHQIETPELDHPANERFDAKPSFPASGAAEEIFAQPVFGQVLETLRFINASFGDSQRTGRDIGRDDLN